MDDSPSSLHPLDTPRDVPHSPKPNRPSTNDGGSDSADRGDLPTVPELAAVHPSGLEQIPLPGTIGRYVPTRVLGSGSWGVVYLANDPTMQREVVLKVPFADLPAAGLELFQARMVAAARLHHPNICPIYEVGVQDGIPFVAMARVKGRPLHELLASGKPISSRQAAFLVHKIAAAIREAHDQNVLHLGLAPRNLLVTKEREPILVDFGLGTAPARPGAPPLDPRSTVAYLAPEQVAKGWGEIGPRTDIYSLGVLFYQLLTGLLPNSAEGSETDWRMAIALHPPRHVAAARPGLDPKMVEIWERSMAKVQQMRYASMAEMVAALAERLQQAKSEDSLAAQPNSSVMKALYSSESTIRRRVSEAPSPGAGAFRDTPSRSAEIEDDVLLPPPPALRRFSREDPLKLTFSLLKIVAVVVGLVVIVVSFPRVMQAIATQSTKTEYRAPAGYPPLAQDGVRRDGQIATLLIGDPRAIPVSMAPLESISGQWVVERETVRVNGVEIAAQHAPATGFRPQPGPTKSVTPVYNFEPSRLGDLSRWVGQELEVDIQLHLAFPQGVIDDSRYTMINVDMGRRFHLRVANPSGAE